MSNVFGTMSGADLVAPGAKLVSVTASDTVDLPYGVCRALLVGTAGNASIIDADGVAVDTVPLQVGYNPVGVQRIKATGLTAANIFAIYSRQSGTITSTVQIVKDSYRNAVIHINGVSDGGTQEINVPKVVLSDLTHAPKRVNLLRCQYSVPNGSVELSWDADLPDTAAVLSGYGTLDYKPIGGLVPVYSQNSTGNINVTTRGFVGGSTYVITLELVKHYTWKAKAAA